MGIKFLTKIFILHAEVLRGKEKIKVRSLGLFTFINVSMKIEVLLCVRLIQSQKEVSMGTITGLAMLVACQE